MRVLHLVPSISPLRGGPSQAALSMVAALREQGVDASILTTNDHGEGIQPAMPLGIWHEHESSGQPVPMLAFGRWNPPMRAFREFAIAPGLSQWLEKHAQNYDLVHVHALFSYTTSIGMAQLRRQRIPYVMRTIGQLNQWSLGQSAGRKKLFLKLLDRANLDGAAALHFTSDAEHHEAAGLKLRAPSFVLPLGVPLIDLNVAATHQEGPQNDIDAPLRFLFFSRIHPKKQLPLLFEALAKLKQRQPSANFQLEIAGDGDHSYINELKRIAMQRGLVSQIRWHGFVAGSEKQALLQQADWFVLPSASENFGIAAAESLMAGTPVLLSPGVALAKDVQAAAAGVICEPTVEALASSLERCLVPPSLKMRQSARQLAEQRFSWASISCRLIQHYEEVLRA